MENKVHIETQKYFDDLWAKQSTEWDKGNVQATKIKNGTTDPAQMCISTIARLINQETNCFERVQKVIEELKLIDTTQHYYPQDSLHITVLGLTQHQDSTEKFSDQDINRLKSMIDPILQTAKKVKMHLKGLGVVGNQVFIQVYPNTNDWEKLREELDINLQSAKETPISYPNKSPIHLNLIRITDNSPEKVNKLYNKIKELHEYDFGETTFHTIELLITDFFILPEYRKIIQTYKLN